MTLDRQCTCGHDAAEHDLVDHDANVPAGVKKWRQEQRLARWHWVCTADVHPDGQADSPWDHVCGCIHNIWDHKGYPTIGLESGEVKALLREAMKEHAPA